MPYSEIGARREFSKLLKMPLKQAQGLGDHRTMSVVRIPSLRPEQKTARTGGLFMRVVVANGALIGREGLHIFPVLTLTECLSEPFKLRAVDEPLTECDLFRAGDAKPLSRLNRCHKV
jgi:hypothetical protein